MVNANRECLLEYHPHDLIHEYIKAAANQGELVRTQLGLSTDLALEGEKKAEY